MRPTALVLLSALAASCLAEQFNIEIFGPNIQNPILVLWENTSSTFLPGYQYHSNFTVHWAIPNSSLSGLDADEVSVLVVASAQENSTVSFEGFPNTKRAEFYLTCTLQDRKCGPNSTLGKRIEFTFAPSSEQPFTRELISINASLAQPAIKLDPASILSSLSRASSTHLANLSDAQNSTLGKLADFGSQFAAGISPNSSRKGPAPNASSQQASFLLQNPLVSLVAFALVILVTGAYLLKNRD